MRKSFGVLAVLLLCGGEARSEGWSSWLPFHSLRAQRSSCAGCNDDSPLCPEMTHWSFQRSQCKQPWCWGHKHFGHGGYDEIVAFPPLPYGNGRVPSGGGQAASYPTASPWSAGAP
jgi:hypothetical protein